MEDNFKMTAKEIRYGYTLRCIMLGKNDRLEAFPRKILVAC